MAPDTSQAPNGIPAIARGTAYVVVLVALPVVAFAMGAAHFEAVNCSSPDFDGECDVAAIEGLVWSVVSLVGAGVVVLIIELRLAKRRLRGSPTPPS